MRQRFILWRLFASFLAVVLIPFMAIGWYTARALNTFNAQDIAATLDAHANLAAAALEPLIRAHAFSEADALCKQIGAETGTRITVIQPDGVVTGDSFESITRMENHANRPEIQAAFAGRRGSDTRLSRTLGERLSYRAVPVIVDGKAVAVVRASLRLVTIEETAGVLRRRLALGLAAGVLIAFLAAWLTNAWLIRPVTDMRESIRRIAEGDHQHRLTVPATRELARFAGAMNTAVSRFDTQIADANRHLGEGDAILSSMIEGVLAVDRESHVISMNDAAGELLGIKASLAAGLPIEEAAPNREIQRFVAETLVNSQPIEEEFTLRSHGDDVVQAQGTVLRDGDNKRIGAVVVLHDVTRLRKLEQVRRAFVANVSHELKTPITAIKGYVETLLDGNLHDAAFAERSMQTVATHANRLNAIIEDLLSLSRIEEDEGAGQRFEAGPLRPVLAAAIQQRAVHAENRGIEIDLHCDPDISLRMNSALLEQAVLNLIENAIQYSNDCGHIEVRGETRDGAVRVDVTDHGCGIAPEHLPHVFERFYRVETSGACRTPGTGLGLAIVQHIARVHEGSVHVVSEPGEGSTFTIELAC